MTKNAHIGSSFDDFLEEEGILEEAASVAVKRVISWQVVEAMKAAKVNKSTLAKRMKTSRSQLDRVLDETDTGLTLDTLSRAATALGYHVQIGLVAPKHKVKKVKKIGQKAAVRKPKAGTLLLARA